MSDQTATDREADLLKTLVALADTMIAEYDEFELLHDLVTACVRILDTDTAGLSLAHRGELGYVAGSDEQMRVIELFQSAHQEGPCVDSFRSGVAVHAPDISARLDHWPRWAPRALELGFRAADAFPLVLRQESIGALNLYSRRVRSMGERDILASTALADMATIGILHDRAHREGQVVQSQLEMALQSRIVIEQAKGVIAEREGIAPHEAFDRLRQHSRSNNVKLPDTARQVVAGDLRLD
jgi:hypothetical protein